MKVAALLFFCSLLMITLADDKQTEKEEKEEKEGNSDVSEPTMEGLEELIQGLLPLPRGRQPRDGDSKKSRATRIPKRSTRKYRRSRCKRLCKIYRDCLKKGSGRKCRDPRCCSSKKSA